MAEAAVDDRPQLFYCHMCNVQFENASTVSMVKIGRELRFFSLLRVASCCCIIFFAL